MRTSKKGTTNYLTDREILKLAKEANIDYAFKKELVKFAWIIVEKHNEKTEKTNAAAL